MTDEVLKVAHLGDIHASEKNLEEAYNCLKYALYKCVEEKVRLIIVSGDTWDGPILNRERSGLANIVNLFNIARNQHGIPIVMIYGTPSHDILGSLEIFREIGVRVFGTTERVDITPFSIICFPYSRSLGIAPKDKIMERLIRLSTEAPPQYYRLFTAHMGLKDVPEAAWGDVRMPDFVTEDLKKLGCHYYALGHIHDGEMASLPGNIRYCGSLFHTDFGDISKKGFNIVHFDNGQFLSVKRIYTPSTPILNLSAEEAKGADVKGKRIKIKLRVDPDKVDDQSEDKLREELLAQGAVEVKIDRIVMPRNEIRESLAGAETLAEKVKIWCEATGRVWDLKLVEKCEEIEANVVKEVSNA